MQKLSAVIIAFNEERNIKRCLHSLQGVADEIIVVDSYSVDNTASICEKHGAKVVQQKWQGYSEQKNFANRLASHDYILSIDADEALSEELRSSILNIKNEGLSGAYQFNRLNNYCGHWIKHSSWYPDTKLRIWNKNKGEWQGEIHETIAFKTPVNIQLLKGDLLHYSYYEIKEHIAQANKFSEIAAEDRYRKGKTVNFAKVLFAPFFKFIKEYFIKLGILDGKAGLIVCMISSHETFLKYSKLYFKHLSKKD
ncbi:MAG: glycosyltransferase family 2 protein [Bacteroidales bacterium]|nr:glycosyltransferase family 2 protein [Bacteroidales bacterium]